VCVCVVERLLPSSRNTAYRTSHEVYVSKYLSDAQQLVTATPIKPEKIKTEVLCEVSVCVCVCVRARARVRVHM
jgi:hypothetical protein